MSPVDCVATKHDFSRRAIEFVGVENEGAADVGKHAISRGKRLLEAMGVGPDGIAGPSSWIGGQGDMAEARRWLELPGITEDVAIAEVRRVMASKRDTGPPGSFKYFTTAMQRLSGELTADQLKTMEARNEHTNPSRAGSSTRHTRGRSAHDSFLRGFQSAAGDFDG
ncbi:hypothetical protein B6V75_03200 [Thioclava sp. F1Mire-8]|uniref:hypothetical protein n=1 Tax=Thioclava sp. F1Mire-8 TaxID=1973006 RepID=UPI000B544816|nr:hypothetical protein [Thioclava sp. F1Mire-8]OWY05154.1 hypothetical protein B6V75_03200 [Thioclava sp. F1Mire-8]